MLYNVVQQYLFTQYNTWKNFNKKLKYPEKISSSTFCKRKKYEDQSNSNWVTICL